MMIEKDLISVVVPVYNREQVLKKCVDSLLDQNYGHYEVILVDDGSRDGSGVLCDEFAQKYPGVSAFHKANGGVGSARNYGVRQAGGQWIVFVDADDYVTPSYLQDLWNLKEKHNADAAMAGSLAVNDNGVEMGAKLQFDSFACSAGAAILETYLGARTDWSAYNKLLPKSVLLQHPFPGGFYEDMAVMYKWVDSLGTIAVGDCNENYRYVQYSSGTILNSALTEKHLRGFDICENFGAYIDAVHPELAVLKTVIYVRFVVQMLHKQTLGRSEYKTVFLMRRRHFRRNLVTVVRDRRITRKIKLFTVLLCTNPVIYRTCHRAFKLLFRKQLK